MEAYFPKYFGSRINADEGALRLNLISEKLEEILGEVNAERVQEIEKSILYHNRPRNWNVWTEDNAERAMEVDFNKFAISVVSQTGQDLDKLSTFSFYSGVEYLEDKNSKGHGNSDI